VNEKTPDRSNEMHGLATLDEYI